MYHKKSMDIGQTWNALIMGDRLLMGKLSRRRGESETNQVDVESKYKH